MTDLAATLEAILFVAESPLRTSELVEVTERSTRDVQEALSTLSERLEDGHGIVLREVAGGWRLFTRDDTHNYIERFASTDSARRLSNAAVETLAVVAYKQPVSRGQVTEIRGVDSDHALRTLQRRDLVREVGRAPGPGQAVLYGTTDMFLEKLGVASLADLPPLADHVPPSEIMETLEMPLRPEPPSNDSTS